MFENFDEYLGEVLQRELVHLVQFGDVINDEVELCSSFSNRLVDGSCLFDLLALYDILLQTDLYLITDLFGCL